jgi:phosphatidylserine synthase
MFPLTPEQKRFGVQIDSLADVLAFGLVPVVCLHRCAPPSGAVFGGVWFACGFFYLLCAVTRLAYYNITESTVAGFIGVPSTLLGIFWSGWLLWAAPPIATVGGMVAGGAAMVSPLRVPRPGVKVSAVVTLVSLSLAIAHAVRLWS